jgi:hypothetical protein
MTIPVEFREATPEDLPQIVRLLAEDPLGARRERAEEPLPQPYRDAFERMRGQPSQLSIIHGPLAPRPDARADRGCASPGNDAATESARRCWGTRSPWRSARADRLAQLTTDRRRAEAHRFYERLGFKASHLGMKLDLAAEGGAAP